MDAKHLKEAAEDRLERLMLQFEGLEDDVQSCLKTIERRETTLEKAHRLRATLRGMGSTVERLEREVIEQMTILRTLNDLGEE